MQEQAKRQILLLVMAVTSLPAILLVRPPTQATLTSITLYLSAIAGYLGIMLILWMYALGAKSIFGVLFRDIAPIMRYHRRLGTYGAVAILLHPLLIVVSYGESVFYSVVPHIGTQFERHVTLGRISFLLFAVVWFSSALLRGKMQYRPWKYLHYLAYICLPFALLHIPGTGTQFLSQTAVKAYFFAIVAAFLVITLLRLRGFLNLDKHRYVISHHRQISPETYLLEVKPTDTQSVPEIGQYVYLKLGFISEDHPFSVVTVQADGTLLLAYRATGRFTEYLKQKSAGTTVYISDPHGSFLESADLTGPTVYIAGGIGITPFVKAILETSAVNDTWLFYANRTRKSSAFFEPLAMKLGPHSISILSNEDATDKHEENGYLSAEILRKHLTTPERYSYYICGPKGFMNVAQSALASMGVSSNKIKLEAFDF